MLSVKIELLDALAQTLEQMSPGAAARAVFESPKVAAHGDLATTAAMQLAKPLKQNPRQLAEQLRLALLACLPFQRWVEAIDIAGPGFINIKLKAEAKQQIVREVLAQGAAFGSPVRTVHRMMVEFVSANWRGFCLSGLAICMAAVVARSPWAATLGDSKTARKAAPGDICSRVCARTASNSIFTESMGGFYGPAKKICQLWSNRVFFWHDATMTLRTNLTPSISCVIPAFNEARNLGTVVPHILATLSSMSRRVELIVIDDGSRDDTAEVMRTLCASHRELVYLQLSRNFGKEPALTAGIDAARGDVVLLMDADGQHPVELLPTMLEKWQQGADVVYAVRKTRDDQSGLQVSLTGLFYKLVNFGNRVQIPANAGDFRLMDRKVVEALKSLPERNRFMKGLYAWVGFNSTAIDYQPLPRADGKSNFGLRGSISLALTGILAFSIAPLRALTLVGMVLSALALGYGAWVVGEYFITGIAVAGYATIVVGMMFFSGIQLLSIGILAEYVGRIYEEVKQRPAYLISQRQGRGLPAPESKAAAAAAARQSEQQASLL